MDNRELRAMLLSAIHLPPLPAIVNRMEGEMIGEETFESSHALLGGAVDWAASAGNQAANCDRMLRQFQLLAQFRSDLSQVDMDNYEDIYNLYCDHTRRWLGCYLDQGKFTLFKPLDSVTVGDKVHANMLDYTKAQYFHFYEKDLDVDPASSYRFMLRKCAIWTKKDFQKQRVDVENTK